MYHRVASVANDPWHLAVAPEALEAQLRALQQAFEFVPLSELGRRVGSRGQTRPPAAITFDDGYLDNLTVAKPILERFAAPATVFLVTGLIGRRQGFWWDRLANAVLGDGQLPETLEVPGDPCPLTIQDTALAARGAPGRVARKRLHDRLWAWLSDQPDAARGLALSRLEQWSGRSVGDDPGGRAMDAGELRALTAGGLVDVGAHTVTHPRLSRLTHSAQAAEIEQSREDCRALLGRDPVAFSYPNGDCGPDTSAIVRRAGFELACDSRQDLVWSDGDPLRVPRISVRQESGAALARRLRLGWLT
jgi:peptidoglycan/xylan/chitin deacetylase (PgdA/CDA1 family)